VRDGRESKEQGDEEKESEVADVTSGGLTASTIKTREGFSEQKARGYTERRQNYAFRHEGFENAWRLGGAG
jgi:CxxC motif-containing protein (DUF1111 family)